MKSIVAIVVELNGLKIAKIKYNAKLKAQKTAIKEQKIEFDNSGAIKVATKKVFTPPTIEYIKTNDTIQKVENAFEGCVELDYITRSINACRELDVARNKMQGIIDTLKMEQSRYNKEDYEFAHTVEASGNLTAEEKLQVFENYKVLRSKRRDVKGVIKSLITFVRYIPMNTEQLFKDALNGKIELDKFYNNFYKQRLGGGQ